MMSSIPILDYSKYTSGDPDAIQEFSQELGSAFQNIGFASIKNHDIDNKLLERFYATARSFFDLPLHKKLEYHFPELHGQRGYTSFGVEHAKDNPFPDLKEFWHFGQKDDVAITEGFPINVAVQELPEFNEMGMKLYTEFLKTGINILRSVATFLSLDKDYFTPFVKPGNSILRPIHYPPVQNAEEGAIRAGAHEDINLITLLASADGKGLEVLNKAGEWVAVNNNSESLVINVGDMLDRLSNGVLRSTTHRVSLPTAVYAKHSRYSIPFFVHPVSNMSLNCLEHCIMSEGKKKYEDISAGEFLEQRLREIGLM
jgi:isopenicillin N synthase-like dioxygenase